MRLLLLIGVLAGSTGSVLAGEVTFATSSLVTLHESNNASISSSPITLTVGAGESSNQVRPDGTSSIKFQSGTTLTISGTGVEITGVTISETSSGGGYFTTASTGTISSQSTDYTQTWTGTAESVTLTNSTKNLYVTQIVVTYKAASTTPSFAESTVTKYTTDITANTTEYTNTVNNASGYTISSYTVTSDANGVVYSIDSSTGTVTLSGSTGTATISATYTNTSDASDTGTITYTLKVSKPVPTLTFEYESFSITLGTYYGSSTTLTYAIGNTAYTINSLSYPSDFTETDISNISYTSSNTSVATVDGSGHITIVGTGEIVIIATYSGGDTYAAGEASYTLTISKPSAGLSYPSSSVTVTTGGTVSNTLSNPNSLTGIKYSSSDTDVATIDAEGNVTLAGGTGTTTISAYYAGDATYGEQTVSYELTVNAASNVNAIFTNSSTSTTSTISLASIDTKTTTTSVSTTDGVTLSFTGSSSPRVNYSDDGYLKFQSGTSFTLTGAVNITSVVVNFASGQSNHAFSTSAAFTVSPTTFSSSSTTQQTFTNSDGVDASDGLTFSVSSNTYVTSIEVTYEPLSATRVELASYSGSAEYGTETTLPTVTFYNDGAVTAIDGSTYTLEYVIVDADGNTLDLTETSDVYGTTLTSSDATTWTCTPAKTITGDATAYVAAVVKKASGETLATSKVYALTITSKTPTFAFTNSSVDNLVVGTDDTFTNALIYNGETLTSVYDSETGAYTYSGTTVTGLTITYESGVTSVATVAADGTVTIWGAAGNSTITATVAATAEYKEADASFPLSVTNNYSFAFSEETCTAETDDGTDFTEPTYTFASGTTTIEETDWATDGYSIYFTISGGTWSEVDGVARSTDGTTGTYVICETGQVVIGTTPGTVYITAKMYGSVYATLAEDTYTLVITEVGAAKTNWHFYGSSISGTATIGTDGQIEVNGSTLSDTEDLFFNTGGSVTINEDESITLASGTTMTIKDLTVGSYVVLNGENLSGLSLSDNLTLVTGTTNMYEVTGTTGETANVTFTAGTSGLTLYDIVEESSKDIIGITGTSDSDPNVLVEGMTIPDGTVMYLSDEYTNDTKVVFYYGTDVPDYPYDEDDDNNKIEKTDNDQYSGTNTKYGTQGYLYFEGIPLESGKNTVTVAYYSGDKDENTLLGSKTYTFTIDATTVARPDAPTFKPETTTSTTDNGSKEIRELSTTTSVDGATGNMVYAKYSNGRYYELAWLINAAAIQKNLTSVAVFTTTVSAQRQTTGAQVKYDNSYHGLTYDIISERTIGTYFYVNDRLEVDLTATSYIEMDLQDAAITMTASSTTEADYTITASSHATNSTESTALTLSGYSASPDDDSNQLYLSATSSNTNVATVSVNEDGDHLTVTITPGTEVGEAVITLTTNATNFGKYSEQVEALTLSGSSITTVAAYAPGYESGTVTIRVKVTDEDAILPPTISPTSQTYYNAGLDVTISAQDEYPAYYVVREYDADGTNTALTAEDIAAAEDKVELAAAGYKRETLAAVETEGDGYIIYAVSYQENEDGTTTYSTVTSETYTYDNLVIAPPLLTPPGADSYLYKYSEDELTITASLSPENEDQETEGVSIYYTINATSDEVVVGGTGVYRYDATEKIQISASCIIRVVSYKDGVYSDVVTYQYNKVATKLKRPWYTIEGIAETKDGPTDYDLDTDEETGENGATVEIEDDDEITLTAAYYDTSLTTPDWVNITHETSGYTIYYTTDGNEPTRASNKYTGPFTVDVSCTIKAFVYADDGSVSEVSVLYVTISATGGMQVWEATDETTNSGSSLKALEWSKLMDDTSLQTYALDNLTFTFGDGTTDDWTNTTVGENNKGTAVDGIGDYNMTSTGDAVDELGLIYHHGYAAPMEGWNVLDGTSTTYTADDGNTYETKTAAADIHTSTFKLPSSGAFVKFEPEKDGEITIWALQSGGLYYAKETDFLSQFIRKRPAYFVDESGHSIKPDKVKVSGTLSSNWFNLDSKNFLERTGSQDGNTQKYFTKTEAEAIYSMYSDALSDIESTAAGDALPIIYLNDGTHQAVANAGFDMEEGGAEGSGEDYVIDGTGVLFPSATYVRYDFPVLAGKTYFFFVVRSKVGIRGIGFKASTTASTVDPITIDATNSDDAGSVTSALTTAKNAGATSVTLTRSFTKDTWAALTLPFSVSATKVQEVFGEGTQVVHFNRIRTNMNKTTSTTTTDIVFTKHDHQMIVAGTPVLIKPTNIAYEEDGKSIIFDGVQIEQSNKVDDIVSVALNQLWTATAGSNHTYTAVDDANEWENVVSTMTGSYTNGTVDAYDIYVTNSGTLKQMTGTNTTGTTSKPTRAWIKGDGTSSAKGVSLALAGKYIQTVFDNGESTGIEFVETDDTVTVRINNGNIYTVGGQLVRSHATTTEGLAKGIYLWNGRKVVVE